MQLSYFQSIKVYVIKLVIPNVSECKYLGTIIYQKLWLNASYYFNAVLLCYRDDLVGVQYL